MLLEFGLKVLVWCKVRLSGDTVEMNIIGYFETIE